MIHVEPFQAYMLQQTSTHSLHLFCTWYECTYYQIGIKLPKYIFGMH